MRNFNYLNPTKIYFGRDAELQIADIVKQYGSRVLIVHYRDAFIKASGLIERIRGYMEKADITCWELDGIKPNPLIEKVYERIELCKKTDRSDSGSWRRKCD